MIYLSQSQKDRDMNRDFILIEKLEEVKMLCLKYEVDELYFFGSFMNEKFRDGFSDLDVLVHISDEKVRNIVRFKFDLKAIFGCQIEVFRDIWIAHKELDNYLRKNKKLIFKRE